MPNVEGKSGAIPVLPASALLAPPTYDAVQPTNTEKTWNVSAQHDIAQYTHAPAVESFGVDGLAAPATHTSSNALETEPPEPMPASFTSDNHPPPTNPTFTQPLPQYVAQASPYYVPYNTSPAQGACCVTQGQFENSLLNHARRRRTVLSRTMRGRRGV
ncbi:hypothetical protein AAVH_21369 [Aphelenchoides avenae]|nr:hypothetical protein AAVH_21369 [Aphelenchus avenae]